MTSEMTDVVRLITHQDNIPVGDEAQLEGGQRPARILVVDDDERNLLAIQTVLEDVSEVVIANSGEEALRHLLKGEFAVILLDVYMPGMDGYETAHMIRLREQTKRIPIIFLSAVNKEMEHLIRGYSMGAVDYVFKPVEPVVLRSKVAVFVDLFLMRKEIQRKACQEQALLDAALVANAERLKAERELRLIEQRQAAIIRSLPIILYLEPIGASPRVPSFVSGAFDTLTGYSFAQVQASPTLWHDRLHPEDRETVTAALAARDAGRSFAVEYRWQCADGRYKHFLDQAVLLSDARGLPREYAGSLLDITERKNLETELLHVRKMDAIGQLTGGIAHDFNNLLSAVIGGLGLIERRVQLNEDQQKILGMTLHAAEQGAELVSRLLAFARKQKLAPAPVDLLHLSKAVHDLLSHTLGGFVELVWEIAPDIGSPYADEAQLELALMNLAINARDAMPNGGLIRVSGRIETVNAGNEYGLTPQDYIVLAVADNGHGISKDMLERVMEPFFTTKAVGKGTGLGLSMVYGFATQSGGQMRMESEEGKGTVVEIWLPKAEADQDIGLGTPPLPFFRARELKILLVDDHEGVRATMAALLEDLGHCVLSAPDGTAILAELKTNAESIDLIISDYAMPHLTGSEVIRRARLIKPGLPAILITGYAEDAAVELSGTDAITVLKPFTARKLQEVIASLF